MRGFETVSVADEPALAEATRLNTRWLIEQLAQGGPGVIRGILSECNNARELLSQANFPPGSMEHETVGVALKKIADLNEFHSAHEATFSTICLKEDGALEDIVALCAYLIGDLSESLQVLSEASKQVFIDWGLLFRAWKTDFSMLDVIIDVAARAGHRHVQGQTFRAEFRAFIAQSPDLTKSDRGRKVRRLDHLRKDVVSLSFVREILGEMRRREEQDDEELAGLLRSLQAYANAPTPEGSDLTELNAKALAVIDAANKALLAAVIRLQSLIDGGYDTWIEECCIKVSDGFKNSVKHLEQLKEWFLVGYKEYILKIKKLRKVRAVQVPRHATKEQAEALSLLRETRKNSIQGPERALVQCQVKEINELIAESKCFLRVRTSLRYIDEETSPSLFYHPDEIIETGRTLLSDLQAHAQGQRVRDNIAELVGFAEILRMEARCDGVLWCEVSHLQKHRSTLEFLHSSLAILQREAAKILTSPPALKPSGKKKSKKKSPHQPSDTQVFETQAKQDRFNTTCSYIRATVAPEVGGSILGGAWQPARPTPSPSKQLNQLARQYFSKGTFASPWASLVYHFAKHTHRQVNANMPAYVKRAREARSQWQGQYAMSVGEAQKMVKVVSNARTWLVFTDDDQERIVSYRDRSARPYARKAEGH